MRTISVFIIVFSIIFSFIPRSILAQDKKLSRELNVFNWEDYFGLTTLKDFEKKFKVKVNLQTYKDEDAMLSALQSNPAKYDIIVASDDSIRELRQMRLLAQIDLNNIPNLKNVERKYRNPWYDPGNKFSIPYLWGTTGLSYNTKYIKEKVTDWDILWDPKLKGKIAMLNNIDEVIGAGLISLGYSLNSADLEELKKQESTCLNKKSC